MSAFDTLMQAKSEVEFFILLSHLVRPDYFKVDKEGSPIIGAELKRGGRDASGYALKYEIEQSLIVPGIHGGTAYEGMTTHVFTLSQDGTLTWWMLGQPTITGLKNIQEALQRLRDSIETKALSGKVG